MRYWIFQANPKIYRLEEALMDDSAKWNWQVNQHKSEIHRGDRAALWLSGTDAGIYAVA